MHQEGVAVLRRTCLQENQNNHLLCISQETRHLYSSLGKLCPATPSSSDPPVNGPSPSAPSPSAHFLLTFSSTPASSLPSPAPPCALTGPASTPLR